MFRRLVTALVLLNYVVLQAAAVPHAHSPDSERSGDRPHFHVEWLPKLRDAATPCQRHAHGHAHGRTKAPGKGCQQEGQCPHCAPVPGHDEGCVYLPDAIASARDERMSETLVRPLAQPLESAPSAVDGHASTPSFRLWRAPPDPSGRHCALYLKLQVLRI